MEPHYRSRFALFLATALLLLATCRRQANVPPNVIARVGDRHVTLDEFKRYLERSAGMELAQISPKAASPLLDQYLEEVLLSEYAATNGMDVPAERIADAVRNDAGSTVVEKKDELRRAQLLAALTARVPEPDDEQVRSYYMQHPEEFRSSEQLHVRQILVRDAAIAAQIIDELQKGAPFEALSGKHSKAPNADRGGEIGFVGRGQLPKIFEDEIFRLKPGQVSRVIETDSSYHIFKVEEYQAAGQVPLQSVEAGIRARLKTDAINEKVDEATRTARAQLPIQVLSKRVPFAYTGPFPRSKNE